MHEEPHTEAELEEAKAEYITATVLHLVEVGLTPSEAGTAAMLAAEYADSINTLCKGLSSAALLKFDPEATATDKVFNREEHAVFLMGLIEGTALQMARMQTSLSSLIDLTHALGLDWPGQSRLAHLDEDGNICPPSEGSVH